jgi:hypothetical protein
VSSNVDHPNMFRLVSREEGERLARRKDAQMRFGRLLYAAMPEDVRAEYTEDEFERHALLERFGPVWEEIRRYEGGPFGAELLERIAGAARRTAAESAAAGR